MMAVEAYHTVVRTYIRLVTLLARLFLPLSYGGIDLHTTAVLPRHRPLPAGDFWHGAPVCRCRLRPRMCIPRALARVHQSAGTASRRTLPRARLSRGAGGDVRRFPLVVANVTVVLDGQPSRD